MERQKGTDPNMCSLEGVQERPEDCVNNPYRYGEYSDPQVCFECPGDPSVAVSAERRAFEDPIFPVDRK